MMSPEFNVISIHGVPRSGTSWLGQIFSSHPDIAYRFQPLFSYQFKNLINLNSTKDEICDFFDALYQVKDDDFILGKWRDKFDPIELNFNKNTSQSFLVMKMVRHHHLIEKFLLSDENLKVIGIVRNPCAVINSWLNAPKEFINNWDVMSEWRYAPSKNLGRIEEYNGFEKWKELALTFLDLEQKNPERFLLIQYEQLVTDPNSIIENAFYFVGLKMERQVLDYIKSSQSHHSEDANALFKSPNVKDKWRSELDQRISGEIINEIHGTVLARFMI